jgi:hypothetical protein
MGTAMLPLELKAREIPQAAFCRGDAAGCGRYLIHSDFSQTGALEAVTGPLPQRLN